jgi:hypothetical protein
MPSVVYLLCGLTGSGKTTSAKRLEAGGAVRLSVDEEVYARHGRYGVDDPMGEYVERERPGVEELRRRLEELVEAGRDVVLDDGCGSAATATPTSGWSRRMAAGGGCCTSRRIGRCWCSAWPSATAAMMPRGWRSRPLPWRPSSPASMSLSTRVRSWSTVEAQRDDQVDRRVRPVHDDHLPGWQAAKGGVAA